MRLAQRLSSTSPGRKQSLEPGCWGNPTHPVFSVYENETTLNLWVLYKPRSQSWTSLSISHPATVSPSPVNTLYPMTLPPPRPEQGACPGPSGTCLIPVLPEPRQPSPALTGAYLPPCVSSAGADHTCISGEAPVSVCPGGLGSQVTENHTIFLRPPVWQSPGEDRSVSRHREQTALLPSPRPCSHLSSSWQKSPPSEAF